MIKGNFIIILEHVFCANLDLFRIKFDTDVILLRQSHPIYAQKTAQSVVTFQELWNEFIASSLKYNSVSLT